MVEKMSQSNISTGFQGWLQKYKTQIITFAAAFLTMAAYLLLSGSMIDVSGDAASSWQSILTFYSDSVYPSYTLYKGFLSVYPYVWFYQLSLLLGVGQFWFIKLYHCALFAYVAAIGLPGIAEHFLHRRAGIFRRIILIAVLFFLWQSSGAFDQLMVDLPCLCFFIGLVHCAAHIGEGEIKPRLPFYLLTGLLFGLNLCGSGQYTLPAVFVGIYLLVRILPWRTLRDKSRRGVALLGILLILAGIAPVKLADAAFMKQIFEPTGKWNAQAWTEHGYMAFMYRQTFWGQDPRGKAILQDYFGEAYTPELEAQLASRAYPMTFGQYIRLSLQYPLDSLCRWGNRFFLSFANGIGRAGLMPANFLMPFVSYTLVFLCLLVLKRRCKTVKVFFSLKLLLALGFIAAMLPNCALCVELRNCLQLQGFVFSIALLDDTLWDGFKQFGSNAAACIQGKTIAPFSKKPFPFAFFAYMIFIILCTLHMAYYFEIVGTDPAVILFTH